MTTYHIAFAVNTAYVPYALVTIHSIMAHQPRQADESYCFHLITEKGTNHRKDVREFLGTYKNAQLVTHLIDPLKYKKFDHHVFTLWTNIRTELPNLLPNVDRVLYLDTDTLVVGDIRPLFKMNLEGKSLAMVEEAFLRNRTDRSIPSYLTLPIFNAGVMLMDLSQLRAEQFTESFWNFLETNYDTLALPDQNVINILYKDRIHPLPQAYNVNSVFLCRQEPYIPQYKEELQQCLWSPIIIHYARTAPWFIDGQKHPFHQLWIDFNHSLKYPAPLTYEAKGKILRFKVWLKMWLMPSCKPLPISIDLLKERWSSIPDA